MTSTDIVTTGAQPLLARDAQTEALIREQFGLQEATSPEIEWFFAVCNRMNLDPFAKQIYAIMRHDKRLGRKKLTIQVSIDGYRAKAAETREYGGSDDAVFVTQSGAPVQATVTVYRIVQGVRCPFTATARWTEYADGHNQQWKSKPHVMLAKCAEALALRKAFPAELGGVYVDAEMQQPDVVQEVPGLTEAQASKLRQLSEQAGIPTAVAEVRISNMTPSEFDAGVERLEQRIAEQAAAAEQVEDAEVVA